MRHIISVLVENEFGVLARVSGLFSCRGFNIESLCVAETMDPSVSRITLVTRGDDRVITQVEKQLNKLINVIRVRDVNGPAHVERELVLIKVAIDADKSSAVSAAAEACQGRIIDRAPTAWVIEMTGAEGQIAALIERLQPIGILEIARTGRVAMSRGAAVLAVDTDEQNEGHAA